MMIALSDFDILARYVQTRQYYLEQNYGIPGGDDCTEILVWWWNVSSCCYSAKDTHLLYDVAKLKSWTSQRKCVDMRFCAHKRHSNGVTVDQVPHMEMDCLYELEPQSQFLFPLMTQFCTCFNWWWRPTTLRSIFKRSPWSRTKRMGDSFLYA